MKPYVQAQSYINFRKKSTKYCIEKQVRYTERKEREGKKNVTLIMY